MCREYLLSGVLVLFLTESVSRWLTPLSTCLGGDEARGIVSIIFIFCCGVSILLDSPGIACLLRPVAIVCISACKNRVGSDVTDDVDQHTMVCGLLVWSLMCNVRCALFCIMTMGE